MPRALAITETGLTAAVACDVTLAAIELTAGAEADATLVVREGADDGPVVASLAALAGTTAALQTPRQVAAGALHCTIAGTGAHATLLR